MSSAQVEELLTEAGEQKCGRFYQRKDGTLVTSDCSVGLKRKRRKRALIGVSAGILSVLGVAMSGARDATPARQTEKYAPLQTEAEREQAMQDLDEAMRTLQIQFDKFDREEEAERVKPVPGHRVIMGRMGRMPDLDEDEDELSRLIDSVQ